jgi:predicted DNA-binding transcriptional regulator AlpA
MHILDLDEAAKRCGIVRRSLERIISIGEGPPVIRISARRRGILESDLLEWAQGRRVPRPGRPPDDASEATAAAKPDAPKVGAYKKPSGRPRRGAYPGDFLYDLRRREKRELAREDNLAEHRAAWHEVIWGQGVGFREGFDQGQARQFQGLTARRLEKRWKEKETR